MEVCVTQGVLCPLSRFVYKILCGSVILVCGGNRVIPTCFFRLYRLNSLCRVYGLLCWFFNFSLVSGMGQNGGASFVRAAGVLCILGRFRLRDPVRSSHSCLRWGSVDV